MGTRHFYWILTGPSFAVYIHTSQSRWESESPERKGVEREEKKEFSLHRELSSPLLSVETDCNFQQFKINVSFSVLLVVSSYVLKIRIGLKKLVHWLFSRVVAFNRGGLDSIPMSVSGPLDLDGDDFDQVSSYILFSHNFTFHLLEGRVTGKAVNETIDR
jgi:hypothetical protein